MPSANQRLTAKNSNRIRSPRERLREKIQLGQVSAKLAKVARGEDDMSRTQLDAAKFLINKFIPDAEPESRQALNHALAKDVSHADPHQLLSIIEGKAERVE